MNQDILKPGKGFAEHSHRSVEILSYVISGKLEHKDSLGNGRVIKAGEFQYMSAGTGVRHSEFNPDPKEPAHFLQIWIQPKNSGGEPSYKDFAIDHTSNGLTLIASMDGRAGSAHIKQEAELYFGSLEENESLAVSANEDLPNFWIQVIKGQIQVDHTLLEAGDGASATGSGFPIIAKEKSEFLLFRLS